MSISILLIAYAISTKLDDVKLTNKGSISNVLKAKLPNQNQDFYVTVLSCYEHSILNSLDPSIIILVSEKIQNLNCVAENLLKILIAGPNKELDSNMPIIESHVYPNKTALDDILMEIFATKKVALIKNMQLIPAKSIMLFYTYGDDLTTAQYKGIVIIFTLTIEKLTIDKNKLLTGKYGDLSGYIEHHMNNLWLNHIHWEQLQPLYTRIGNNIVLVNDEPSCF